MPDLLLSHRFFPPGPQPYGAMLRHIAKVAAESGLTTEVLTVIEAGLENACPSVDAALHAAGVTVKRLRMRPERRGSLSRMFNALSYVAGLTRSILRSRPRVVMVASFPPALPALAAGLAAKLTGAQLVYHVLDIHPEISAPKVRGVLRPLYRVVIGLADRINMRLASRFVTLSDDMVATLVARGAPAERIEVINNYALTDIDELVPRPLTEDEVDALRRRAGFRFIFAGNMGAYQSLDKVAPLIQELTTSLDCEALFIGDGARKAWLMEQFTGQPRVRFLPFMPFAVLRTFLDASDMGIVSLDEQSWRYAYPSKLLTYLGAGLPVMCLVNPQSVFSRYVTDGQLGVAVDPENVSGARSVLEEAIVGGPLSTEGRSRVRARFASSFDADVLDAAWTELFGSLTDASR